MSRCVVAVVTVVTLLPHVAWADPVQAIPPGDDTIVSVKQGEPAPFTGQLFENNTAIRWGHYLEQYKYRLTADVALQMKLSQADVDYQKKLLVLEQEKYTKVVAELEAKNQALQVQVSDPPFYTRVWFGITVGVVAAFGAVGLAAYGLHAVK